ncbi:PREDICTED: uncharacterized protein LOC105567081 [Vollenhovia emeryi]|uniref:uncharacterized protein LOC105567081 n=1 Tax=Vollenhovia emeryi TaxID=411798 RepID=UPI0005F508AF|nr:PREDICTED: uncharacterized protein LOC105567081 [Vollenhovia emeryi]
MDKLIGKYYTNLDYVKPRINKNEKTISALTKDVKFEGEDFLDRRISTAITIMTYLPLFELASNHVDVPQALAQYLWSTNYTHFILFIRIDCVSVLLFAEKGKKEAWSLMLTFLNFCTKEVQQFLETSLIKNSSADNHLYREYKTLLSHQTIEIIVLEDSDLYAVFNYLKTSENCRYLSKIWVPHSIRCSFLSLKSKYLINKNSNTAIRIFKSKQELLTPPTYYKINITSIWSEDIAAARSLATSLDRNIVLINTLDFYDGTVIMPYVEIFKVSLHKHLELDEDQHIMSTIKPVNSKSKSNASSASSYSLLFYDGAWQRPMKDKYWTSEHSELQTADATSEDIDRCVVSARKGFKIWSAWSTESRMQVLSKFANALKYTGKAKLSKTIHKWTKFPHWYENSWIPAFPSYISLVKTRRPRGVVTLMEKEETNLFKKLTQSLIIGNSVIVLHTTETYNIMQYCDLLSTSGIPPGVVNLLSCRNVKPLSECYDASELRDIYHQFTVSKQVATYTRLVYTITRVVSTEIDLTMTLAISNEAVSNADGRSECSKTLKF